MVFFTEYTVAFNRSAKQGFDIVIGNPPYGAKLNNDEKDNIKKEYISTKTIKGVQKGSLDTFTLFIELGYNIAHAKGNAAMIVPISITSSESVSGIHRLLLNHCENIRISSYAVRPQPVFEHAVVNTSIILFKKSDTICQHVYSTKMYRKGRNFDLTTLINNLQFVDVKDYLLFGRIPKISTSIELSILSKLRTHYKVKDYIRTAGTPIVYRFAGGRYFKVVTNYSNGSSAERVIYFDNDIANCIGCILSSNLSFWFYQIYSDNLNWKTYEIEEFRIPPLNTETKEQLNSLYSEYLQDIEVNANIRQTNQNSSYNVAAFKEYKKRI